MIQRLLFIFCSILVSCNGKNSDLSDKNKSLVNQNSKSDLEYKLNFVKKYFGDYDSGFTIALKNNTYEIEGLLNYEDNETNCELVFKGLVNDLKDNELPVSIKGFEFNDTGKILFEENCIKIIFNNSPPPYCLRILSFENNEIIFFKEL